MKYSLYLTFALIASIMHGCNSGNSNSMNIEVIQTSSSGDIVKSIEPGTAESKPSAVISLFPDKQFQKITGIGGAFTESSAFLLNQLSAEKRSEILEAYFGDKGARYSLTRTHMNSCDFSLNHYSYAPVEGDLDLEYFSIQEDLDDIIPMIHQAQRISSDGFKVIASPWTAPPWMKDNNDWYGGKLKKEYYPVWANFFSKYAKMYQDENIPIWAFTVENEPLGNDSHWESMHYTPEETADFVKNHLGPQLAKDEISSKILVYDQNRDEELEIWADVLLTDTALLPYIYGTAVHWYSSTVDWMPKALQYTHQLAPEKHIIHTEGCVDSEVPKWKDDKWYWSEEATDWGWDWAAEEDKHHHPKYVPVYRYANDIIGCLNNWVEGWVDWNMVLDTRGGPNLAQNWCVAPVIVDPDSDEVYYTPLYYVMYHFSHFIRPDAHRIDLHNTSKDLNVTAVKNVDGSIIVVLLNSSTNDVPFEIQIENQTQTATISASALQTIIINP